MNQIIKNTIKRGIKRVLGIENGWQSVAAPEKTPLWSIGIYTGESPFALTPAAGAQNPVLTGASVTDVPARFVADPFMIKAGDIWYMFFEVLNSQSGLGEIGLASSRDMVHWQYRQIVLRESFHLSYPYVFEWNNDYYMIPESYQASSVRLYRALGFPLRWEFVGNLLVGDNFEDSSIFRTDDGWWLLTDLARPPYYAGTLRLFHADNLLGPWTEHPRSPVIDGDPHIARPAGRVLVWNHRVIRFTQDCCPVYGIQVRAFEITKLTTTEFKEQAVDVPPVLQGSGGGWNESGMHHVDAHFQEDGKWVACVDGWHWNS